MEALYINIANEEAIGIIAPEDATANLAAETCVTSSPTSISDLETPCILQPTAWPWPPYGPKICKQGYQCFLLTVFKSLSSD